MSVENCKWLLCSYSQDNEIQAGKKIQQPLSSLSFSSFEDKNNSSAAGKAFEQRCCVLNLPCHTE